MGPKDKYSKFAKVYDKMEKRMKLDIYKREAVSLLSGKILEVGIGSGANLQFYRNDSDVTGIDFSIGMLNLAEVKAKELDLPNLKLFEMNIENMSFPDNSFDSVLSSCVFCTVPNPKKGLQEIHRVLKPGGKVVFLEHMKSDSLFINLMLKFLNIFSNLILGTSLLRETEKMIRETGFSKVESKNLMMKDVLRLIIATK